MRFLEIWCGESELKQRTMKHINALRTGALDERHVFYFSQALARTPSLPAELQHKLLTEARDYLKGKGSQYAAEMDKSHVEVRGEVVEDLKAGRGVAARKKLLDDGYNSQQVEFFLGDIAREELRDFPKAEHYYLMAVEKGHANAINNLAVLYQTEFKNNEKAEHYYLMAVEKGHISAMFNLAGLYRVDLKDMQKAEQYYLMAVGQGDADAMYNLAETYFERGIKRADALKLKQEAYRLKPSSVTAYGLLVTLLWNNEIPEALNVYHAKFENEEAQKEVNAIVSQALLMFLAKKQYNFVYRLFEENKFEIREKYKAIYYALLSLMGDEHADELKRMGPELHETMTEILKSVGQFAVDYA